MRTAVRDGTAQTCVSGGSAQPPWTTFGERVRRELLCELEAAVGFADYCRYVGGPELDARAEAFVAMAEALYGEALSMMARRAEHRQAAGAS